MPNQIVIIALVLTIAVLAVVVMLLKRKRQHHQMRQATPDKPAMQAAPIQLSMVEQCCLQTLQQVAGSEYNIRTKIALSELSAGGMPQIMDFVLFSKKSGRPKCVIQLQSAATTDDKKMVAELERAEISLYHLPRKSSYSIMDIRNTLADLLDAPSPSPDQMVETISMRAFRLCDKCEEPMQLKRASAGPHKGMIFWVCKNYPKCQNVELYTE